MSHLHQQKFKHNFQVSLRPICSGGKDNGTSAHFLRHCPNYSNESLTLLNIRGNIDKIILAKSDLQVTETLRYGDSYSNKI